MLTSSDLSNRRLLAILARADGPVSGERLARALGTSRVAVWQRLQRLRRLGYPIETSRRGYALAGPVDLLAPWELSPLPDCVLWAPECTSTMDEARRVAERTSRQTAIVVAERQTRGRGRGGRSWISPAGGIYVTFLRRPRAAAALAPRYGLAAALAVRDAVAEVTGLRVALKWPNDIVFEGRKLGGILVETATEGDLLRWVAVGIGLNVLSRPPVGSACSLAELLSVRPRRAELFAALVRGIESEFRRLTASGLESRWMKASDTLGRRVEVATALGRVTGTAVGVDEWGALVLRRADGGLYRVPCGDCRYLKEAS